MNIGVVLARGGSKRLPRKNLMPFGGIPLVEWAIIDGGHAALVDRVVLSTDDEEIAAVGFKAGAIVINRPEELAQDHSTSYDALKHVIEELGLHDHIITLLQPTSPLRDKTDINGCIRLAMSSPNKTAMSVEEGEIDGNGAIYVAPAEWILSGGNWDEDSEFTYAMPYNRSIDIDTIEDFDEAVKWL